MRYVIVGGGVAGTTGAAKIRKFDPEAEIIIVSDEEFPLYSRIRLIDVLSGEATVDDIILKRSAWYKEQNIGLILGDAVVDVVDKKVKLESGQELEFDRLLIATGANAFVPPIPGRDLKGVFSLRRIPDALGILEHLGQGKKKVVVVGGGVLGLEAANALMKRGHTVEVVEALPRLLPRQTDPEGSLALQNQMENMGLTFHIGRMTKEILGRDHVKGVILDNGLELHADLVLISAGIRANIPLAEKLGMEINRGIVVDDGMHTGVKGIYAAGDAATHRGINYGIWPAADKEGAVAGENMAGGEAEYEGSVAMNVLKVMGIDLVAIGNVDAECKEVCVLQNDKENHLYRKLIFQEGRIVGAILIGDKTNWVKVQKAIGEKRDVSEVMDRLQNWDLDAL